MRNIDIKMKLKLIVGLIGVLSLSSFFYSAFFR